MIEPLTYLDGRGTYCLNPSERPKKYLWVFGDSFTAGNGCLANELYTKYKKSDEDIIWPEIISSKLLNIIIYLLSYIIIIKK